MITKDKKVYYCEYCKKHGLSAGAMGKHEKHCTANPNRVCRMCDKSSIVDEINKFKKKWIPPKGEKCDIGGMTYSGTETDKRIDKFIETMEGELECPICTLTAIRNVIPKKFVWMSNYPFKDRVAEWWEARNEEERKADNIAQYTATN